MALTLTETLASDPNRDVLAAYMLARRRRGLRDRWPSCAAHAST